MRVLIADADPWTRLYIRHYVSDVAECEEAGTGAEAFALIDRSITARDPYRVCFLEVDLPQMDGHDVLHAMRELERISDIPLEYQSNVIMIASESDAESIFGAYASGCGSYLEKPITLAKLRWHWSQLGRSPDSSLSDTIIDERNWGNVLRPKLPAADASASLSLRHYKQPVRSR